MGLRCVRFYHVNLLKRNSLKIFWFSQEGSQNKFPVECLMAVKSFFTNNIYHACEATEAIILAAVLKSIFPVFKTKS